MKYGHNKLTEFILCCFTHDYLQQMCFCVRQCLKCYLQIHLWYWIGEGCTEVWNNETLFTLYTKAPRTQRNILQYNCLLKKWCTIKYILLSVITNVCSNLIFITENPVSLNVVEPKFTSNHIIFRNGKFFNKYDWWNTSFSYTYESKTPPELLPTKRFTFSGTMLCSD